MLPPSARTVRASGSPVHYAIVLVVEHFNVVEHLAECLVSINEVLMVCELLLERAEETLHHGVVIRHGDVRCWGVAVDTGAFSLQ